MCLFPACNVFSAPDLELCSTFSKFGSFSHPYSNYIPALFPTRVGAVPQHPRALQIQLGCAPLFAGFFLQDSWVTAPARRGWSPSWCPASSDRKPLMRRRGGCTAAQCWRMDRRETQQLQGSLKDTFCNHLNVTFSTPFTRQCSGV